MTEALYPDQPYYQKKEIISLNKFIFLNVITFNLYYFWWQYKAWRLFQERDPREEIMPFWRMFFSIFFLWELFRRVKIYAQTVGFTNDYSPGWLFLGVLATTSFHSQPNYLWIVEFFSFSFFIQPFLALNHYIINSNEYDVVVLENFNTRQIGLIIVGSILWLLDLSYIFDPYLHFWGYTY